VVSYTSRPLYLQGKSRWYPLDRRLAGPQSRSGWGGEEKNIPVNMLERRLGLVLILAYNMTYLYLLSPFYLFCAKKV
jgi:hypothetical protein